jgi:hypothetical protein
VISVPVGQREPFSHVEILSGMCMNAVMICNMIGPEQPLNHSIGYPCLPTGLYGINTEAVSHKARVINVLTISAAAMEIPYIVTPDQLQQYVTHALGVLCNRCHSLTCPENPNWCA